MKPGYKTSEFWLTLFANIAPIIVGGLSPEQQAQFGIASTAIYTIARAITKGAAEWKGSK